MSSIGRRTPQPRWQILRGRTDSKIAMKLIFCYSIFWGRAVGAPDTSVYVRSGRALSSGSKSERLRARAGFLLFNIRLCCRILERPQAESNSTSRCSLFRRYTQSPTRCLVPSAQALGPFSNSTCAEADGAAGHE